MCFSTIAILILILFRSIAKIHTTRSCLSLLDKDVISHFHSLELPKDKVSALPHPIRINRAFMTLVMLLVQRSWSTTFGSPERGNMSAQKPKSWTKNRKDQKVRSTSSKLSLWRHDRWRHNYCFFLMSSCGDVTDCFLDCPDWNYDGSSTYQATGDDSDITLKPVRYVYPCPTVTGHVSLSRKSKQFT